MSYVYGRLTGHKPDDMEKKLSRGVSVEQAGAKAMLHGGGLSRTSLGKANGSWLGKGEGTLACTAGRGHWSLMKTWCIVGERKRSHLHVHVMHAK